MQTHRNEEKIYNTYCAIQLSWNNHIGLLLRRALRPKWGHENKLNVFAFTADDI